MPPQHSPSCAHASPFCTQNEDAPHVPPALQNAEQQSPAAAHGFPSVLHDVLSGVHVPLVPHLSPQHCASVVHAALSAVHWVVEQTLLTQLPVQQSVPAAQDVPAIEHVVGFAAQVLSVPQIIEQQLASPVQPCPNVAHANAASVSAGFASVPFE
jgi:hypothetical protein